MCKLSLLFIVLCLFVILVSLMSDIKRQRNCFFFSSPNFVYSVIINQSRCMTAFRAQTDTKDMCRDEDGKKKDRGKERGRKRGCHRNSKFFKLPRQSRNALGVCLACVCVWGGCTRVYMGLCSTATVPNSACD